MTWWSVTYALSYLLQNFSQKKTRNAFDTYNVYADLWQN